jgi:hypothetical protein
MKQSVILQIVVLLLSLHDFFYLPLSPFLMTLAAAVAAYGITNSLVIPAIILFAAPILKMVLQQMNQHLKTKDAFQDVGAVAVSDRVKQIAQKMPSTTAYDASGSEVTGVLGSATLENFQAADLSGGEVPTAMAGLAGVSVPAYVREKGRMIVVPEYSVAPSGSIDTNPRPSRALITGEDAGSVGTALVSDATHLPESEEPAVRAASAVGAGMAYE